jgi:hypothetical protein
LTPLGSVQRNDGAEDLSIEGSMHRVRGRQMKSKGTLTIKEEQKIIGELIAESETKNARSINEGVRLSDLYEPEQTQIFGAATCDRPGCVMCDVEGGR